MLKKESCLLLNETCQVELMKQSVVFFVLCSLLFEMSAVCLRGQACSDSQIILLQIQAREIPLVCDAHRPSALLLMGEQQVVQKLCIAREEQGQKMWHPAWLPTSKSQRALASFTETPAAHT